MKEPPPLTRKQEAVVTALFKSFDWEAVRRVMRLTHWHWAKKTAPPTLAELKECAREHLSYVLTDPEMISSGGGGFYAGRNGDRITLQFVIADAVRYEDPMRRDD